MRVAILSTDNRQNFHEYDKPAPYFGTAPEALFEGLARIPELEVHVISCVQRPMPAPEQLASNLWYHSLLVPKLGWLRTGYQGCLRAVRKKLREIQPVLVHAQGTERDCGLSAAFSGFPNILTIHGNMRRIAAETRPIPFTYGWLAARLEGLVLRRTWGVLCNSTYTEDQVKPSVRKTWRVPNPMRAPFLTVPATPPPRPARPILVNVGTVTPLKRQVEILEIAGQLQAQGHSFEIHFVGPLDEATAYGRLFRERIRQAETLGYARYLGSKTTHELIQFFDAASAMVHFSGEESFGLVVAEGLSRNLKLFAARVGGIIDIASGVEGAELFARDDWDGLRTALATWLRQGQPRPATASREMAARYHPVAVARQHLAIYREIEALGAPPPAPTGASPRPVQH